ncbi:hypothetical protein ABZT47_02940 [Sphaerisporangium sp. NPDC005289]|uniref:hypothetical protein n=1 Tax=Sphaerisporangium sp. NPDC005289 TaxID=3155247 RepID=UPI0033BDED8B
MIRRAGLLIMPGLVLVSGCGTGVTLAGVQFDDLREQGVSPDLVYVVDLPGYEPARQSVSVYNDEGFQTYYISGEGRQVWFGVDRGSFSDEICRHWPVHTDDPPTDDPDPRPSAATPAPASSTPAPASPPPAAAPASPTPAAAGDLPDADLSDVRVSCDRDEVGWYRTDGDRHEYAVAEDGHVLRLAGLRADVSRLALKEAIATARHAGWSTGPKPPG